MGEKYEGEERAYTLLIGAPAKIASQSSDDIATTASVKKT
jgi:hypothetical protein